MKATEFYVGTHVVMGRKRYKVTKKGQGHGRVHQIVEVDLHTGLDLPTASPYSVSSRDLSQTWAQFLAGHPNYLAEQKAAEQEAESKKSLMEDIKQICEETAGLMCALGFEAKVVSAHYGDDQPFSIVITNPTENQQFLREQVAKKWGM